MFHFLICLSSPTRGIRGSVWHWLPSTSLPSLMLTHPLQLGSCLVWAQLQVPSPGSCLCPTCTGAGLLASPTSHPPWEAQGQAQQDRASPGSWSIQRLLWMGWWALPEPTPCPCCGCHRQILLSHLRQTHVTKSQLTLWKLNKQVERRL